VRLLVRVPTRLVLDEDEVDGVAAEADDGAFAVKPRHVDFVTTLAPGILSYGSGGEEQLLAVDRGVLVKCGSEVQVSVRDAVRGDSLEDLKRTVREHLTVRGEHEKAAASALGRLESRMVQAFLDLGFGD
jgi:F-type H+-transporting ATPase subunit epsilon